MKKKLFSGLLGLILCGLTASATADDCNYCCYDPCEWSSPDGKFFASADWLYWKMEQSNMDIASFSTFIANDNASFVGDKPIHPDHKFNNGFRVTAGYALPCNGWDINVSYFNICSNDKKSANVGDDETTLIFFDTDVFPVVAGGLLQEVGLKWSNNLNNADLDIGRTITFGECFRLRPHVGFRATWMNQNYRFNGFTDSAEYYLGSTVTQTGKIREKFHGYGVEGGVWASWDIGAGFSLIGHVGGSMLYTKYSISADSLRVITTSGSTEEPIEITTEFSNSLFLGTPSLDYFIGFRYSSCFCDTELSAHVGWEQHTWLDVNQFAEGNGNLYTQGLTLGLGVAF